MKPRQNSKIALTHARLLDLLAYSAATGEFCWRINHGGRLAGSQAGTLRPDGYRAIRIFGQTFLAHRLAWFFVHGQWPGDQLDHRNRQRGDNRIENLRDATATLNSENRSRRSDNQSGYAGVGFHRQTGKWQARILGNGTRKRLGLFDTPQLASEAYLAAKALAHPAASSCA